MCPTTSANKPLEYHFALNEHDEIIGICTLKRDALTGFELYLLVVDPHYQRRGIGQMLVAKCLAIARQEAYPCVNCVVVANNRAMLRLLRKNDFHPMSVSPPRIAGNPELIHLRCDL